MRTDQLARFLAPLALVLLVSLGVVACGGGGGSSSGNGAVGNAAVTGIIVQGIAEPLHVNGVDNPGGVLPVGAFLNARVTFTFGGPVDPASIPASNTAQSSSIQIIDVNTNLPANGAFKINPANPSQVFFDAFPPSGTAGCQAGLTSDTTYRIAVNTATSGNGPTVMVGGTPLQSGANPIFKSILCDTNNPGPSFTDTNGVPPSVVATSPVAGQSVNITAIPGFPNSSVVTIDVDEALDPTSVLAAGSVLLVNTTINSAADIPAGGTVTFIQFGLVPGNTSVSRITFTTDVPLADGHVYEIRFAGVTDLSGVPLTVTNPLTFTINDAMNDTPQSFTDDFSTTNNRLDLASAIVWPGTSIGDPNSGRIAATFPIEVIGNGLDGVGSFLTTMTINSDNQLTPGDANAEPATYNFTSLNVGNGTNTILTFQSTTDVPPGQVNWPVRMRSTSTMNIAANTTFNCNGRQNPQLGGGNIVAESVTINGGWGGPGAGRGGNGSPVSMVGVDNEFGLPGEGAHTDPVFTNQPGGTPDNVVTTFPMGTFNSFFGGGGAGQSGFSITSFSTLGAAGGGGGAASGMATSSSGLFSFQAATAGETRTGTDGLGTGAPAAGQPGQPMAYMIPPLLDACGGSGGGAGGDRRNGVGVVLGSRAGGAGSGGGGGLRFSAGGDITLGLITTFNCKGGEGGRVTPPAGFGAGGSGGSIIIQTFANIVLNPAVNFLTNGGLPGAANPGTPNATLDGEGGRGGSGVVQLEDGMASFVTAFMSNSVVNGEALAQVFSFAANVNGTATSTIIDTGSSATDYTSATATQNPGPTGMITITVLGIAEDPMTPGSPATTAMNSSGLPLMVGPVDISQIDQLDGYRFFQFFIATTFPAPPTTMQGDPLPFVDDIQINYSN